ncbi:YceI family protein [Mesonia aestuariivivens]|uniref:YceI family protein n=1 Tax=Mesonia aestuariivivens TaxID=2796128 RepID=A0ABS6W3Y9_9FLAO|nr:YceI family protein [Mesonia aestuariivivens]MBW2962575.1 YceI family protein [Mesonia aestuariivivens]
MKKVFLNMFVVAALGMSVTSCKNEAKNETEAKEAEEVVAATDEAANFNVATEESTIMWVGTKPVGGGHEGTISIKEGSFSMLGEELESGKIVIDMKSIKATDLEGDKKTNLEAHLMGTVEGKEGDFFNVQEYPEATFELTGVENKDNKTWLKGNLTLKGNTKNVNIPATTSMEGDKLVIKSEKFTIDRTDWDVNYGSKSVFDSLVGDNVISDDIQLELKVVANKA